jgi:hypothetical protein
VCSLNEQWKNRNEETGSIIGTYRANAGQTYICPRKGVDLYVENEL